MLQYNEYSRFKADNSAFCWDSDKSIILASGRVFSTGDGCLTEWDCCEVERRGSLHIPGIFLQNVCFESGFGREENNSFNGVLKSGSQVSPHLSFLDLHLDSNDPTPLDHQTSYCETLFLQLWNPLFATRLPTVLFPRLPLSTLPTLA